LEEILGERISEGFIAVKDGQLGRLNRIRVMESAHPVPDQRSVAAGRQVLEIAGRGRTESAD
jgi:hydroxypyruvate reductase